MGLSRQARITTLLVIDSAFFLVELITGYTVGSLALVADSFHMLNDVLSLVVALYTIKLATSPSSNANSYGWQRAEILGALINGVFLVALCVSIALEALGRLIAPPEISNPKVIVIVGSLGLLSNIVGLFLFHEHGHSHGDHSHGSGSDEHVPSRGEIQLPTNRNERSDSVASQLYQHPAQTRAQVIEAAQEAGYGREEISSSFMGNPMSPPSGSGSHRRSMSQGQNRRSKHQSISSRPRPARHGSGNIVPPAVGTNEIREPRQRPQSVPAAKPVGSSGLDGSSSASSDTTAVVESGSNHSHAKDHDHKHKHSKDVNQAEQGGHAHQHDHDHDHDHGHTHGEAVNSGHDHDHSHGGGGHGHGHGHGHSHGSMNMRGVFLHVLGDALGNVGVIAAGLVIWFCEGKWTLYFDPGVSFMITCIILHSAIPLVRSASYILLQGVPSHVSLEDLHEAIREISGVVSVHELHVWQLSESTVVASVHVLIEPGVDYMNVAGGIREVMHQHGIHSVTIQPEFYSGNDDQSETACLIRCPPEECGEAVTCCPPTPGKLVDVDESEEHGHSH
ncbi:cation efflux protein [Kockovaella imperatae]|uniref:Cation efflux protein n=1 Tax=Kockovaella imperatae TaxID=4999 RepID=A0A1Y1U9T8_9TREE|nr:cation efflux protein [Kockovaella imperatae]ORX34276.1 cation efflux protein [Kockovaella imperatae]